MTFDPQAVRHVPIKSNKTKKKKKKEEKEENNAGHVFLRWSITKKKEEKRSTIFQQINEK